ncbi:hypothetical protein CLD22_14300 [Rubrivivax gelatinosus]|nr:hypothetical protein [Rubrivivax gelatinosus]
MTPIATRRGAILAFGALLAGCAGPSFVEVAPGETVIKNRLAVTAGRAWNRFDSSAESNLHPVWTHDGFALDTLRFYVGLKAGDLLAPTPSDKDGTKPLAYTAGMAPQDIVGLFESMISRDGSSFTLDKMEPASLAGQPGVRFEYTSVRKGDEVVVRGVTWFAVKNGELFALAFAAPRLGFFPRVLPEVEAIVRSARLV